MYDFDEDRSARFEADRRFKIGGEVFQHRPGVRPETMAAWEEIGRETSASEAIKITDALMLAWIDTTADPTAHDRYKALRERENDPISGSDLSHVIMWLYRQSSRRPTVAPASSSDGRETTGTTSTETSSTEQAEESAG